MATKLKLTQPRVKVTADDVAQRSGVSRPAVYQAMRGIGNLSRETRSHILRTAHEMGFRVNAAARAIREGRFNAIGLLTSTESSRSYLPTCLLAGLQSQTRATGCRLVLAELEDQLLTDDSYLPHILSEWSVDGLLVNYHSDVPEHFPQMLTTCGIPHVWINSVRKENCVFPDDVKAGHMASDTLIRAGHHRIAFVNFSGRRHYSTSAREQGYLDLMNHANLDPCVWSPNDVSEVIPASEQFLACRAWLQSQRPTAVFAYSQNEAMPVLAAALSLGWRVPGDLSLIAVSPSPVENFGLRMTTVKLDMVRVGEQAVGILNKILSHDDRFQTPMKIPPLFREGVTVTPPLQQN